MKRERGSGCLFQDSYRDPRTGEIRKCSTWTMKLSIDGKVLKKSSGTSSRLRAIKSLDKWKAEVLAGSYVPDADKTTFDDLATALAFDVEGVIVFFRLSRRTAEEVFEEGHRKPFLSF